MEITFFQNRHLESVIDLFRDMSAHYNGANASNREAIAQNLVQNILGKDSGVRLVLALEQGRAIGVACISLLYPAPKEKGQLFMKELYVASGHRDRNVGRKIMTFVARYAIEKSCVRFDWTVDSDNVRAIEFYRSLGAEHLTSKLYFRFAGEQLEQLANERETVGNDG
jgi:ribosomal protein S18 acetylase RimI-like enzyme